MSRCFPFPPPGYEKKPRTDDINVLNKEKHKEKKHKKDKRDEEKKEGKEKREKDRRDGKHREKKDRKEKNRGKKKDEEDRDKDRDKSSVSEEKRVGGQEGYNGEKIHPREEMDKAKNGRSDEKKTARLYQGDQEEKPVPKSNVLQETEDAKYVQELGRRIRNDKGVGSSQSVERFNIMDQRMDDAVDRYSVRDVKNKDKKFDTRKMDDQRIRGDAIVGGIAKATTLEGMASNRFEGTLPLEKKTDKKIEEREKYRDNEGVDKRGDKRKSKDTDKQSQGKDKYREKEKKKEEKAKEKSERKKTDQDKIKLGNKIDIFGCPSHISGAPNHISPQPSISLKTGINEGNFKKRKEKETNGFSHDHETRPNKMARLAAHPIAENERKLETFQSPSLLYPNIQEASSIKLNADHKEHKRNGIIADSPVSASKPKIPLSSSSNHIAQSFPVSMTNPSSSTVMPVSTAKLPSASATENAAAMISISAVKPSSPIANEVAALVMPLVALQPSTTSASEIAAQSISIRKPSSGRANENAAQVASVSTKRPSSATHNAKVSMRPPHPDSKHLNQILTIPKMEEWSDFEDQEWLFGSKDAPLKKPGVPSLRVHEELQVWAEALKIESADIYALPYVVPY